MYSCRYWMTLAVSAKSPADPVASVPALITTAPVKVFVALSVRTPAPSLMMPPVPEIPALIVMFPAAAFMVPVEEEPKVRFILIVWVLAESLMMSPLRVRAVPPANPAAPVVELSV